tara:strand:+ start:3448 stop:3858 length:411 start_codon:yes stop_codon:yes gene_type:complete
MIVNDLVAKFGDVKRQPKGAKTLSQAEKLRKTAPYILGDMLSGEDGEKTIADVIPTGVVPDSVANHIGTCWGNGQGGKGGAQLWKDGKRIRRVRENAVIAVGYMTDAQVAAFCAEHDLQDADELYEKIVMLPSVDD